MRVVYFFNYVMIAVYFIGETTRRGLDYFSINATTLLEDYTGGLLLIIAAYLWHKKKNVASKWMIGAWGYSAGGMFVPFWAHFEAYVRGVSMRPDHDYTDLNAVIMKGIIWLICVGCFAITLFSKKTSGTSSD